jgi:hypothetical protein
VAVTTWRATLTFTQELKSVLWSFIRVTETNTKTSVYCTGVILHC